MSKKEIRAFNYANIYKRYSEVSLECCRLKSDVYMHWCKDDKNIEALRNNAETALENYYNAMFTVYFDEEMEIEKVLREKESKSRKFFNFFKRKGR